MGVSHKSDTKRASTCEDPLPAKKLKLAIATTDEPPAECSSVFSGFFAFAKNVVKSVATSLGSAGSDHQQPRNGYNLENDDKRCEFESRTSESSKNSVFRFTGSSEDRKQQQVSSSAILSPTPANDRLAKLRQDLVKNQKKITNGNEDEDVIMTDDEDTVQSDLTNDSDDGKLFLFSTFPSFIIWFHFVRREYGLGRMPYRC